MLFPTVLHNPGPYISCKPKGLTRKGYVWFWARLAYQLCLLAWSSLVLGSHAYALQPLQRVVEHHEGPSCTGSGGKVYDCSM